MRISLRVDSTPLWQIMQRLCLDDALDPSQFALPQSRRTWSCTSCIRLFVFFGIVEFLKFVKVEVVQVGIILLGETEIVSPFFVAPA